MTLSIWRYAHLALAVLSTAFLLILSTTGVVLAIDAINEKTPDYRVEKFDSLTLSQMLPVLRENYFEVLEVKVDHNGFVSIDATDENGQAIKSYIDPETGKKIGALKPKSAFINWNTTLHRSLFLKETGRTIVGIVSFLLLLISISGFILIIKRQKGLRHFFTKINRDFFSQYFHVVSGRLLLIPVLMIAGTGTLLFLVRLDYFKTEPIENPQAQEKNAAPVALGKIPFFMETKLSAVERIEFPFIPDDEAEPFIIHLKDKEIAINQVTGAVISETKLPYAAVLEKTNIDLHTGRTSIIWAAILGIASLNILFFMYSGFAIMLRRTRTKIKNKFKPEDAEIVLLIGSENGSTLFFANHIHQQLLGTGQKSYLTQLNDFQQFPNSKEIVVFTSTYGLGDPPSNAVNFEELLQKYPPKHKVGFSVVGFGSETYEAYCAFAKKVDALLQKEKLAERTTELYTVNDRSAEEFVKWAHDWSEKTFYPLATAPTVYNAKIPDLKKFIVTEKTSVSEDNSTFKIVLKPKRKQEFQSGDLLAIYPANDNRERFYSIGKVNNSVQLIVKLFEGGLGSEYLYQLKIGDEISARTMANPKFHLPKESLEIAMIANGTGIAPFLGMIEENKDQRKIKLYTGFKFNNSLASNYRKFGENQIKKGKLESIQFAFSREENKQYVMDLIKNDAIYFADLLNNGSIIMICGALKMQRDVELVLDEIVRTHLNKNLQQIKHQILTDCY